MLHYGKFGFDEDDIADFLSPIREHGLQIAVSPMKDVAFSDESDRKFFEVAKASGAVLVIGNMKHFPKDPIVMSVSDFYERFLN